MRVFYNEWDAGAAWWLRYLGDADALPVGLVSENSITDIPAQQLHNYDQCHFFAGIGGWPLALRLAGYEEMPCWTGSPPCQPFSVAGTQKGKDDERHLAPVWLDLIKECCPPILFGEQVADAIRHGWLDDLFNALEKCGYACGAAVLPACSVGAPHIRKRLFFGAVRLADTERWASERYRHEVDGTPGSVQSASWKQRFWPDVRDDVAVDGMADTNGSRLERIGADADPIRRKSEDLRPERLSGGVWYQSGCTRPDNSFWSGADWLGCRDGKLRPVEPGTQPLAHGLPARVGRLRGYGNAIVPQVAAVFIQEFMASVEDLG